MSGTRTRIYEVLAEDFRKEVADIQDTKTRRFYILAKLNNLAHFRAAKYKTLIAAADISENYGVAALLEICLADKLALAERAQQWLCRIAETEVAEKIAGKKSSMGRWAISSWADQSSEQSNGTKDLLLKISEGRSVFLRICWPDPHGGLSSVCDLFS